MKKILMMIAGAALFFAITMGTANAQASGPFADVPTDHWAYQDVDTLQKAGIVIGYPDGTYGGKRAMTRYEFATAIARLLKLIPQPAAPVDLSGYAKTSDLTDLQNSLLQKLADNQQALDALKALVDQFQPELLQLGQDVTGVKARLATLEGRVSALEREQQRVVINGSLNSIVRSNINTSKNNTDGFLDQDGYVVGVAGVSANGTAGLQDRSFLRDVQVSNDILLDVVGRVSDNSKLVLKLDAGNLLSSLGSATGMDPYGYRNDDYEGTDNFTVYEAYYDTAVSIPGGPANAQFGRLPVQFTPYTLKAIDPLAMNELGDSYAKTEETSSGNFIVDGAKLAGNAGKVKYTVYGGVSPDVANDPFTISAGPSVTALSGPNRPGRVSPDLTPVAGSGGTVNIYPTGGVTTNNPADENGGVRLTFGDPSNWQLGVTGEFLRVSGTQFGNSYAVQPYEAKDYTSVQVYGADFHGNIPFVGNTGITLDSEVAMSQTGLFSHLGAANTDHGDVAWIAELGYKIDDVTVKGGYQQIGAAFAAPGYWGHVGTWTNPTNVEGPVADANIDITDNLSLVGKAYFYKGIDTVPTYYAGQLVSSASPLGNKDDLNGFQADLKYGIARNYDVDLGYEFDQWTINNELGLLKNPTTGATASSGKPTEQYITLGVTHNFNQNASLKLLYQVDDYSDHSTWFDPNGDSQGSVALSQLSVKF